jgi:uncharacterized protein (UPF0335 family)
MAGIGDNSGEIDPAFDVSDEQLSAANAEADAKLEAHLTKIERLLEEIKAIKDDIKDEFNLAKAEGYDVPIMRKIIVLRKMKPEDRREMDMLLDTYKSALGMD